MQLALLNVISLSAIVGIAYGCISSGDQNTINSAFSSGGAGAVVQLCQNTVISITGSIQFTAENQELSTDGYPVDGTRATVQIAPGNNASTLISGAWYSGIRILNIQVDGDRPTTGHQINGGANIEIGGGVSGQVVSYVASRNPRGWSCLHIIGSGNAASPCTGASITHNDIGPCGQEGTDSEGNGLWADGISLDCTSSTVSENTITGSTDGGIVIFGSPGSTIENNVITSSSTDTGFGAINMVDDEYDGSYSGVTVTGNKITGTKLFNLGIGIGAYIWSFNDPNLLSGPAIITGNTFSGNIAFPIALNGWTNGITITGNDVSQVTTPGSNFADASTCDAEIQTLFNDNDALVYYGPGVAGSTTLQSNFVAAAANMSNFLCTTSPLPASVSYEPNQLNIASNAPPFARLHGIVMQYQGDSNVVVYNTTNPAGWTAAWASGHTVASCGNPTQCQMSFQGDGNLVTYYGSTAEWSTGTAGTGAKMVCTNEEPWIQILNDSGNVIWDTTMSQ